MLFLLSLFVAIQGFSFRTFSFFLSQRFSLFPPIVPSGKIGAIFFQGLYIFVDAQNGKNEQQHFT